MRTARYAGSLHPLVVVDVDDFDRPTSAFLEPEDDPIFMSHVINLKSRNQEWPSPIELVVCVRDDGVKRVGSCGFYEAENGSTGDFVSRGQHRVTVRVVIAGTGRSCRRKS